MTKYEQIQNMNIDELAAHNMSLRIASIQMITGQEPSHTQIIALLEDELKYLESEAE